MPLFAAEEPSPHSVNQDFRFGLLATSDPTSNRLHWSRFSGFSIPSDSSGPGRGQLCSSGYVKAWKCLISSNGLPRHRLLRPLPTLLLRVRKSLEVPHFKQFPRHLSVPFPPSPGLVPLRRRTLSGWHRQTLNPPHHASKQAPRQMALGQHQPVVTGMLHQPPARLHEPLLQARQRPVVDPLR